MLAVLSDDFDETDVSSAMKVAAMGLVLTSTSPPWLDQAAS